MVGARVRLVGTGAGLVPFGGSSGIGTGLVTFGGSSGIGTGLVTFVGSSEIGKADLRFAFRFGLGLGKGESLAPARSVLDTAGVGLFAFSLGGGSFLGGSGGCSLWASKGSGCGPL